MRVLITGFEAYWDYPENSSWMVAERVANHGVEDVDIVVEQMPVSFSRVASALRGAVEKHNPDLIIMLGQSGGSDRVKLERVALNLMDARRADNDGYTPDEEPIQPDTPTALLTNLPIKNLRKKLLNNIEDFNCWTSNYGFVSINYYRTFDKLWVLGHDGNKLIIRKVGVFEIFFPNGLICSYKFNWRNF